VISIKNLNVQKDNIPILKNINLSVEAGEFLFLKGDSGSGKSTLLKILYKDWLNYQGELYIDRSLIKTTPTFKVRRLIGTIFQNFELLDKKTTIENIVLAGEILGKNEKLIHKEALRLLERVGLGGKENRYPYQLSGGEQQRVAIARALLNRPKILLADEPTGNLDNENALNVIHLLKEICLENHITMLIVTHSEELIRTFPSRTLLMKEGEVSNYEHH
jgi:cell division transport system ATP-binding protein